MHAIDSGEPDGTAIPDLLRFSFKPFVTSTPTFVIPPRDRTSANVYSRSFRRCQSTQGNIVVHDAQPELTRSPLAAGAAARAAARGFASKVTGAVPRRSGKSHPLRIDTES